MKRKLLSTLIAGLRLALCGAAQAAISDGVWSDRCAQRRLSGPYADLAARAPSSPRRWRSEDYLKGQPQLKVEVVSADHQNKPDVGSSIARKWFDSDGVDMIVDVPTSSVALAINQVMRKRQGLPGPGGALPT